MAKPTPDATIGISA